MMKCRAMKINDLLLVIDPQLIVKFLNGQRVKVDRDYKSHALLSTVQWFLKV
jgi:hypothetical protein